jgi:7 transmembrane sweet-taste receptor of 3 GCPR
LLHLSPGASVAIPLLYAEHLLSSYRVVDAPDPVGDFASDQRREILRRDMVVLAAQTIFGPVSFDGNKRNVGRGAAGTQWLRPSETGQGQEETFEREQLLHGGDAVATSGDNNIVSNQLDTWSSKAFTNVLVAPFLQASASTVIPSPSAGLCDPGYFGNETRRKSDGAMLASGCSECPIDTYLPDESLKFQCTPCSAGSSTDGLTGQTSCVAIDDNLLSPGILSFGYVMVALTWLLCLAFMSWIWTYRNDPVVNVSQKEFLILICVGAMISSSTIIALSFQAGSDEDTAQASTGCTVAPFLYTIGWALQYSSLTAKTFRLFTVMKNNQRMRRVKVTFRQMSLIVVIVLAIDVAILVSWAVVSPLVYDRSEDSVNVNAIAGVITIETVGSCMMKDPSISFWVFAGPIMAFHFGLLVLTNVLMCFVRDVSDRYQEQKYIGLSSMLMFEILIVGLPVLVAVNDSPEATYIILVGIIALADIGILCFTFIPKIYFQRTGLEEGVGFGESIMKESYRRASTREMVRRDSRFEGSRFGSGSEGGGSMTSRQMAMAAAVVRSGAFAPTSMRPSWAENWDSSANERSVIPGIEEETDSQVGDIDQCLPAKSKILSTENRPSHCDDNGGGPAAENPPAASAVKQEGAASMEARTNLAVSAAESTDTTTSLTEKSSVHRRSCKIPLVIETGSSQRLEAAATEEDDSSSGQVSSMKEER